jgi:hypothetical protein|tara:strand:- start:1116 stop:1538 length:423 start_codon:yes stop_codon:yes gene_type:complete
MSSEKYLYFRKATTAATDDDEVTGSTVYPLSSFRGMCSGTSDQKGAVTDDADAFTMFFTPKASSGSGGDADDAQGDNVDSVVVAITTDNNQKVVMEALLEEFRFGKQTMITVFDGGAGGASSALHSDIEDITVQHVENAD